MPFSSSSSFILLSPLLLLISLPPLHIVLLPSLPSILPNFLPFTTPFSFLFLIYSPLLNILPFSLASAPSQIYPPPPLLLTPLFPPLHCQLTFLPVPSCSEFSPPFTPFPSFPIISLLFSNILPILSRLQLLHKSYLPLSLLLTPLFPPSSHCQLTFLPLLHQILSPPPLLVTFSSSSSNFPPCLPFPPFPSPLSTFAIPFRHCLPLSLPSPSPPLHISLPPPPIISPISLFLPFMLLCSSPTFSILPPPLKFSPPPPFPPLFTSSFQLTFLPVPCSNFLPFHYSLSPSFNNLLSSSPFCPFSLSQLLLKIYLPSSFFSPSFLFTFSAYLPPRPILFHFLPFPTPFPPPFNVTLPLLQHFAILSRLSSFIKSYLPSSLLLPSLLPLHIVSLPSPPSHPVHNFLPFPTPFPPFSIIYSPLLNILPFSLASANPPPPLLSPLSFLLFTNPPRQFPVFTTPFPPLPSLSQLLLSWLLLLSSPFFSNFLSSSSHFPIFTFFPPLPLPPLLQFLPPLSSSSHIFNFLPPFCSSPLCLNTPSINPISPASPSSHPLFPPSSLSTYLPPRPILFCSSPLSPLSFLFLPLLPIFILSPSQLLHNPSPPSPLLLTPLLSSHCNTFLPVPSCSVSPPFPPLLPSSHPCKIFSSLLLTSSFVSLLPPPSHPLLHHLSPLLPSSHPSFLPLHFQLTFLPIPSCSIFSPFLAPFPSFPITLSSPTFCHSLSRLRSFINPISPPSLLLTPLFPPLHFQLTFLPQSCSQFPPPFTSPFPLPFNNLLLFSTFCHSLSSAPSLVPLPLLPSPLFPPLHIFSLPSPRPILLPSSPSHPVHFLPFLSPFPLLSIISSPLLNILPFLSLLHKIPCLPPSPFFSPLFPPSSHCQLTFSPIPSCSVFPPPFLPFPPFSNLLSSSPTFCHSLSPQLLHKILSPPPPLLLTPLFPPLHIVSLPSSPSHPVLFFSPFFLLPPFNNFTPLLQHFAILSPQLLHKILSPLLPFFSPLFSSLFTLSSLPSSPSSCSQFSPPFLLLSLLSIFSLLFSFAILSPQLLLKSISPSPFFSPLSFLPLHICQTPSSPSHLLFNFLPLSLSPFPLLSIIYSPLLQHFALLSLLNPSLIPISPSSPSSPPLSFLPLPIVSLPSSPVPSVLFLPFLLLSLLSIIYSLFSNILPFSLASLLLKIPIPPSPSSHPSFPPLHILPFPPFNVLLSSSPFAILSPQILHNPISPSSPSSPLSFLPLHIVSLPSSPSHPLLPSKSYSPPPLLLTPLSSSSHCPAYLPPRPILFQFPPPLQLPFPSLSIIYSPLLQHFAILSLLLLLKSYLPLLPFFLFSPPLHIVQPFLPVPSPVLSFIKSYLPPSSPSHPSLPPHCTPLSSSLSPPFNNLLSSSPLLSPILLSSHCQLTFLNPISQFLPFFSPLFFPPSLFTFLPSSPPFNNFLSSSLSCCFAILSLLSSFHKSYLPLLPFFSPLFPPLHIVSLPSSPSYPLTFLPVPSCSNFSPFTTPFSPPFNNFTLLFSNILPFFSPPQLLHKIPISPPPLLLTLSFLPLPHLSSCSQFSSPFPSSFHNFLSPPFSPQLLHKIPPLLPFSPFPLLSNMQFSSPFPFPSFSLLFLQHFAILSLLSSFIKSYLPLLPFFSPLSFLLFTLSAYLPPRPILFTIFSPFHYSLSPPFNNLLSSSPTSPKFCHSLSPLFPPFIKSYLPLLPFFSPLSFLPLHISAYLPPRPILFILTFLPVPSCSQFLPFHYSLSPPFNNLLSSSPIFCHSLSPQLLHKSYLPSSPFFSPLSFLLFTLSAYLPPCPILFKFSPPFTTPFPLLFNNLLSSSPTFCHSLSPQLLHKNPISPPPFFSPLSPPPLHILLHKILSPLLPFFSPSLSSSSLSAYLPPRPILFHNFLPLSPTPFPSFPIIYSPLLQHLLFLSPQLLPAILSPLSPSSHPSFPPLHIVSLPSSHPSCSQFSPPFFTPFPSLSIISLLFSNILPFSLSSAPSQNPISPPPLLLTPLFPLFTLSLLPSSPSHPLLHLKSISPLLPFFSPLSFLLFPICPYLPSPVPSCSQFSPPFLLPFPPFNNFTLLFSNILPFSLASAPSSIPISPPSPSSHPSLSSSSHCQLTFLPRPILSFINPISPSSLLLTLSFLLFTLSAYLPPPSHPVHVFSPFPTPFPLLSIIYSPLLQHFAILSLLSSFIKSYLPLLPFFSPLSFLLFTLSAYLPPRPILFTIFSPFHNSLSPPFNNLLSSSPTFCHSLSPQLLPNPISPSPLLLTPSLSPLHIVSLPSSPSICSTISSPFPLPSPQLSIIYSPLLPTFCILSLLSSFTNPISPPPSSHPLFPPLHIVQHLPPRHPVHNFSPFHNSFPLLSIIYSPLLQHFAILSPPTPSLKSYLPLLPSSSHPLLPLHIVSLPSSPSHPPFFYPSLSNSLPLSLQFPFPSFFSIIYSPLLQHFAILLSPPAPSIKSYLPPPLLLHPSLSSSSLSTYLPPIQSCSQFPPLSQLPFPLFNNLLSSSPTFCHSLSPQLLHKNPISPAPFFSPSSFPPLPLSTPPSSPSFLKSLLSPPPSSSPLFPPLPFVTYLLPVNPVLISSPFLLPFPPPFNNLLSSSPACFCPFSLSSDPSSLSSSLPLPSLPPHIVQLTFLPVPSSPFAVPTLPSPPSHLSFPPPLTFVSLPSSPSHPVQFSPPFPNSLFLLSIIYSPLLPTFLPFSLSSSFIKSCLLLLLSPLSFLLFTLSAYLLPVQSCSFLFPFSFPLLSIIYSPLLQHLPFLSPQSLPINPVSLPPSSHLSSSSSHFVKLLYPRPVLSFIKSYLPPPSFFFSPLFPPLHICQTPSSPSFIKSCLPSPSSHPSFHPLHIVSFLPSPSIVQLLPLPLSPLSNLSLFSNIFLPFLKSYPPPPLLLNNSSSSHSLHPFFLAFNKILSPPPPLLLPSLSSSSHCQLTLPIQSCLVFPPFSYSFSPPFISLSSPTFCPFLSRLSSFIKSYLPLLPFFSPLHPPLPFVKLTFLPVQSSPSLKYLPSSLLLLFLFLLFIVAYLPPRPILSFIKSYPPLLPFFSPLFPPLHCQSLPFSPSNPVPQFLPFTTPFSPPFVIYSPLLPTCLHSFSPPSSFINPISPLLIFSPLSFLPLHICSFSSPSNPISTISPPFLSPFPLLSIIYSHSSQTFAISLSPPSSFLKSLPLLPSSHPLSFLPSSHCHFLPSPPHPPSCSIFLPPFTPFPPPNNYSPLLNILPFSLASAPS
ncbi:unnamed protein product [Acanthosepion pharaonis]|uniref:Uncharacterized protein n=1 Tax=Acanthosepion pharaonis TaxID=158019 RepID=A0A812BLZ5_ACAPH|nr:unnamed protein product [Sepia pharaonis]